MSLRLADFPAARRAVVRAGEPVDFDRIEAIFASHGGIPPDYRAVISELGACALKGPDEPENYPAHLQVLARPVSAIWSYYRDREILSQGAAGDVVIVALDSTGAAIGYDTGAGLRLVTVDNYRIVVPLPMTFDQIVFGLIACWPENPELFRDGLWKAGDGRWYGSGGAANALQV